MTSPPHQSHLKYRPDIDGLRAIAVLTVVTYHAFPDWLTGGFIGVDVFFVISGYLISTILFESLERGTFSFAVFYARRIRRIFPALLVVLLASCLFGWFVLFANDYKQLGKHIAAGAGFVSNFVLWNEAGYFDNTAETKPLLHLWCLAVEGQFYLVWPLLLWIAWKRKFNLLTTTFLVAILSFYLNIEWIYKDAAGTFYLPQTRFWELLGGSLLAWTTLYKEGSFVTLGTFARVRAMFDARRDSGDYPASRDSDAKTLANILSFLGLLLLISGFYGINNHLGFPGKWAIVPVLGTALIIAAGPRAWINRSVLSHPLLVWFGLISYPLYLWHWPLLSFARIVNDEAHGRSDINLILMLVSIVLAWLTYTLVEKPLRSAKPGIPSSTWLVLLMIVLGYMGFNIYSRDGLRFRHTSNVVMDEQAIHDERAKYRAGALDKNFAVASVKVLVYGDSQVFDLYKSLRNDDRIGIKIYQSSYECTAFNLPKGDAKLADADVVKDCNDSFAALMFSPELKQADILIYSIYWVKEEEPSGALEHYRKVLAQIRAVNPKIRMIFFGPKPLLGKTWVSINAITKDQKSIFGMDGYLNKIKWIRDVEAAYVKTLAQRLGVAYVDVNEVFCWNGCQFYVGGQFTHFDQNHWTEFGAQLFLDKFISSKKFNEFILE